MATKFLKQLEERGHKIGELSEFLTNVRETELTGYATVGELYIDRTLFGSNEKDCISVNEMRGILKNLLRRSKYECNTRNNNG